MDQQLASLTWPIRALAVLLASFALGSLLITTIGQYAAMVFTMRRRIREFGVRIALGASTVDILTAVTREGLWLTAVGLAIGCGLSPAAATGCGPCCSASRRPICRPTSASLSRSASLR